MNRVSVLIIDRYLYGLKSSGSYWCANIAETLNSMGYRSTYSDPDVWFKRAVDPSAEEYYKYILVYVEGIIHLAHDPKEDMDVLNFTYILKE